MLVTGEGRSAGANLSFTSYPISPTSTCADIVSPPLKRYDAATTLVTLSLPGSASPSKLIWVWTGGHECHPLVIAPLAAEYPPIFHHVFGYDIMAGHWVSFESMFSRRYHHTAATWRKGIIVTGNLITCMLRPPFDVGVTFSILNDSWLDVIGGLGTDYGEKFAAPLRTCEFFTFSSHYAQLDNQHRDQPLGAWHCLADLPFARYGHACIIYNDIAYVFGGRCRVGGLQVEHELTSVWSLSSPHNNIMSSRYDHDHTTLTVTWTRCEWQLPFPFEYVSTCIVDEHWLMMVGLPFGDTLILQQPSLSAMGLSTNALHCYLLDLRTVTSPSSPTSTSSPLSYSWIRYLDLPQESPGVRLLPLESKYLS
jgi:hypothetical protein